MEMLSVSNRQWYKSNKHEQGRASKFVCHWLCLSRLGGLGGISFLLMAMVFLTACLEINIDKNAADTSKKSPPSPLNEVSADGNNDLLPSTDDVFDAADHNSQWQPPGTVHTAILNQRDRIMVVDSAIFPTGKDQGFMVIELEVVSAINDERERKQQVFRFEEDTNWYEMSPLGDVDIDSNISILTNQQGLTYALWKSQDGFLWVNDFTPITGWQVPQAVNQDNRVHLYQMIFNADGQLIVLWTEQSLEKGALLYARRFSAAVDLSDEVISLAIAAAHEMSFPVRLAEGSLLLALGVTNAQGSAIHMARVTPEFTWQESLWTVNLGEYTLLEEVSDQGILLSYHEARSMINAYALTSVADAQTLLKLAFGVDNGWGDMAVVDFAEPTDKPDQISILQATVNKAGDMVLVWHNMGDDLQYHSQIISHDNKRYRMRFRPFASASKQMKGFTVRYAESTLLASWLESDRFGRQRLVFKQSYPLSGHNITELVHGFAAGESVLQSPGLTFSGSQPPYLSWVVMSPLNEGMYRLDWMVSLRQMVAVGVAANLGTTYRITTRSE